jgi:hypothetical protein
MFLMTGVAAVDSHSLARVPAKIELLGCAGVSS